MAAYSQIRLIFSCGANFTIEKRFYACQRNLCIDNSKRQIELSLSFQFNFEIYLLLSDYNTCVYKLKIECLEKMPAMAAVASVEMSYMRIFICLHHFLNFNIKSKHVETRKIDFSLILIFIYIMVIKRI